MVDRPDVHAGVTAEIRRLHVALEAWFHGSMAAERFDRELAEPLHPAFEIVMPSGTRLGRDAMLDGLRAGHGANPDFRITIEEPRLLGTWPGLILAGYVELQTGARNSAAENRRRSTVLFEVGPRMLWRHLHETGLES